MMMLELRGITNVELKTNQLKKVVLREGCSIYIVNYQHKTQGKMLKMNTFKYEFNANHLEMK